MRKTIATHSPNEVTPAVDHERVFAILEAAKTEKPSAQTFAELQKVFEQYPQMWRIAGDMSRLARQIMTGKGNVLLDESVKHGMAEIEKQLGYLTATPLERLLIEQIVTRWLGLHIAEIQNASAVNNGTSLAQADHLLRRLESAQRGYLRAIETLARVRRLLRPAAPPVQVNIGEKQVNVTQATAAEMRQKK